MYDTTVKLITRFLEEIPVTRQNRALEIYNQNVSTVYLNGLHIQIKFPLNINFYVGKNGL